MLLFSPPCELIKLMHYSFQLLVNLSNSCTLFSPPCELIKLMHSFFTTVWTYQTHALFFHHRVNLSSSCTPFSPPCKLISLVHSFSDCWHSDLYPTHARTLWFYGTEWKEPGNMQRRKLCGTETLLGLLVWVRFQIKSIFIIHQYAQHKYYHWRELQHFFYKTNTIFYKTLVATKMVL